LNTALASAGFTLFAPMTGDGTVYLIDLRGNIVHQWKLPYPDIDWTNKEIVIKQGRLQNEGVRWGSQMGMADRPSEVAKVEP
jgi:hypothetical protein